MTTPSKAPTLKSTHFSKKKQDHSINSMSAQPVHSPSSPSSLNLPSDPKNWSSAHVATYLHQCLQLHPPSFIDELLQFIQSDTSLTGRKFLRLKDDQLRSSGYDDQWIEFVMLGVKSLRRKQLKEKILLKSDRIFEGEFKELEDGDTEVEEENDNEDDSSLSLSNPNSTNFNDDASETFPKLSESNRDEEANNVSNSLFSTTMFSFDPVNWELSKNNISEWIKKEILGCETYGSGLAQGLMLGGAIVWACMKINKR